MGPIAEEHAHRYLDLGIKLGFLTPTFAVSERGELLRAFFAASHGVIDPESPDPNPLVLSEKDICLRIVLLDAILREDILFYLMLAEFVDAPDAGIARAYRRMAGEQVPGILMRATDKLYASLHGNLDIHTALELQSLAKYRERISEKKNHLNQALPRMEFAVDLGLVARAERSGKEPIYSPTETTRRFVAAFDRLRDRPIVAQDELDEGFFASVASTFDILAEQIESENQKLLWFCRGFKLTQRQAGFTPGRTAAFAGAVLALESHQLVEIADLFDAVYAAADGPWSSFLGFSGGSRFDREFLIRIDDSLVERLEQCL